jgi:hypothetical protein
MTLDELKSRVKPEFQPWVDKYGAALLAMSATELQAWIEYAMRRDVDAAYKALLAKMPSGDLLAEWSNLNADWSAANAVNAQQVALAREATALALRILLAVAVAAVGL